MFVPLQVEEDNSEANTKAADYTDEHKTTSGRSTTLLGVKLTHDQDNNFTSRLHMPHMSQINTSRRADLCSTHLQDVHGVLGSPLAVVQVRADAVVTALENASDPFSYEGGILCMLLRVLFKRSSHTTPFPRHA